MSKPTSRKRKGPKSTRAGCLMCKPQKHQNAGHAQDRRQEKVLAEREKEADREP